MKRSFLVLSLFVVFAASSVFGELKPGVRGVITRAPGR